VEEPAEKPKSRRRSRSRAGAAATEAPPAEEPAAPPSSFGEVIDLGEETVSEIVEVPETDAPQRRSCERVRKPVTAVLAGVVTSLVQAPASDPSEAPASVPTPEDEGATEPDPVDAQAIATDPEPANAAEPNTEEAPTPEPGLEEAQAEPDRGPKRRGWWSRAIGGS
jgi:ribonuclease E